MESHPPHHTAIWGVLLRSQLLMNNYKNPRYNGSGPMLHVTGPVLTAARRRPSHTLTAQYRPKAHGGFGGCRILQHRWLVRVERWPRPEFRSAPPQISIINFEAKAPKFLEIFERNLLDLDFRLSQ